MNWNYRVVKTLDENQEPLWGVHEVHYDRHGKVDGWTESSVSIISESLRGLQDVGEMFRSAFLKRPLDCTGKKAVELTVTGRKIARKK